MGSRGRASVSGGGGMPGRGGGKETEPGPPSAGASLRPHGGEAAGEGGGGEGGGEMLSGHLRLPAAKTHSHLSCETQDQYLIHREKKGGRRGERLDLSPIITSYLLDCIDHAWGGCCSLRKHGSYCCGYRRHERQIWTPSAVNRRLPLRLG